MAASGFVEEKELEYPINPPGWTVESRDALLEPPVQHTNGPLQTPALQGLGFQYRSQRPAQIRQTVFCNGSQTAYVVFAAHPWPEGFDGNRQSSKEEKEAKSIKIIRQDGFHRAFH